MKKKIQIKGFVSLVLMLSFFALFLAKTPSIYAQVYEPWTGYTPIDTVKKRKGLILVPSITYAFQYTNNFFLTETNADEEILHVVSPGVGLTLKSKRHSINGRYQFFFTQAQQDSSLRRYQSRLELKSEHKLSRRISLKLREGFAILDDPNFVQRGSFTGREIYAQNIFTPEVNYLIGRQFQLTFGYLNQYLNFFDSNNNDTWINGGSLGFQYQIDRKNRLGLVYRFSDAHFLETGIDDYQNHTGILEWRHAFSPRFGLGLFGGLIKRFYDSRSTLANVLDGYGGVVLSVRTPRQTMLEFSSRYGRNTVGEGQSFRSINADLKWQYRLMRKLYFKGSGYYQFNDFQTPAGVREHVIGATPSFQYRFYKWFFVEALYDLIVRKSNLADSSYTAHTGLLKFGALFPTKL